MSFKIAALADLHLPDELNEMHVQILQEALTICRNNKVDAIVCAGDMIKAKASSAASFFIKALEALPVPTIVTKGNTEMEIASFDSQIQNLTAFTSPTVEIFAAEAPLPPKSNGKFRVRIAHYPLKNLPEGFDLQISGHYHYDSSNNGVEIVRGLDPDKVIGGSPAVAIFEIQNGKYSRSEIPLKGYSISEWRQQERTALLKQLGVAVKVDITKELEHAIRLNIPAVEILYHLLKNEAAPKAIANYLKATQGKASIHLPDISFEKPNTALEYVKKGVDLGIEHFTIHVPKASIIEMANKGSLDKICEFYCQTMGAAPNATFGIENMHMVEGEDEFNRRFGYTPNEQISIIKELQGCLPNQKIGAVLDIGHARNNGVFYQRYSLSQWYEALRGHIVAMHLHQVTNAPDGLHNHTPITGWYQSLISLASFIREWQNNTFNGALLFIECRGGWESSYAFFREALTKEPSL